MGEGVAPRTRKRGPGDSAKTRLGWFALVSLLLHVPLTPLASFIGLLALLRPFSHEAPAEELHAIPVSLLSPEEMAAMGLNGAPPEPPAAQPPPQNDSNDSREAPELPVPRPKPRPKPKPRPIEEDAGSRHETDAGPDAGKPPERREPEQKPAAVSPDGGSATPPEPKPDPMAMVGKSATIADPNANVKLLLLNDRLRGLPIAERVGRLVGRLPQWQSFFGPTTLDPIRDIERLYVAGPQFRSSADVVAIVQYGAPRAAIKKAIDSIVAREPKGKWLDGPVPAALAHADRADRVFVFGKKSVLLMVPPHLADDARAKASTLSFPAVGGAAAVVASVQHPWRALMGLRLEVDVPHTIETVFLSVTPSLDGGATLHVEMTDDSPEAAEADAALLTRAINALTQRNVGAIGALLFGGQTLSLIEPIELESSGKMIRGDAKVTPRQLDRLLGFAEGWVESMSGGPPLALPPRGASSSRPLGAPLVPPTSAPPARLPPPAGSTLP